MSTLRKRIRDVTDALGKDEWVMSLDILERIAEPKPQAISYITTELKLMSERGFLERRGRRPYRYRSGPRPIVDGRSLLRGPRREMHHLGFAALARLEQEDPEAWARETANDRGFKGGGSRAAS